MEEGEKSTIYKTLNTFSSTRLNKDNFFLLQFRLRLSSAHHPYNNLGFVFKSQPTRQTSELRIRISFTATCAHTYNLS